MRTTDSKEQRCGNLELLLFALLALASTSLMAQSGDSPTADGEARPALEALRPCRAPEFRQFDFWVGDWDVINRQRPDRPPAHNKLTLIDDGCALLERYDTPTGYTGTSISFYDQANERWAQTWIDNQGSPIHHFGGLVDGSMVLMDQPAEGRPLNRTTWTPLPDGTVRQHWEVSNDGGRTWSTVFDGLYTKR